MLSPSESVEVFIRRALARSAADTDDEMLKSLLADSIDRKTGECLVAFVPMAFAHVILGDLGVRLPDGFLVNDPSGGSYAHGKLRDEPIFVAAHARAHSMLSGGADAQNSAREIASVSAQWNASPYAIPRGSFCQGEATAPGLGEVLGWPWLTRNCSGWAAPAAEFQYRFV